MALKDCCFTGDRELKMKDLPTGAGAEENQDSKAEKKAQTAKNMKRAAELQEMLYAEKREGLIIALQARDAAGKDSLIKKVFSGLNPAGLAIHSYIAPNGAELAHDYLWRIHQALPARGGIAVLNRSHYEDVLAVRVHHLEKTYRLPERCLTEDFFQRRYRQIRDWETYLWENGYRMVKVFLNVSAEEQKRRFLDRLELSEKHWKLSVGDMKERLFWEEYDRAFEECINATAAKNAPWYILPADNKWYTRYLMSEILVRTLESMDPHFPPLDPEEAAKIPAALQELDIE